MFAHLHRAEISPMSWSLTDATEAEAEAQEAAEEAQRLHDRR